MSSFRFTKLKITIGYSLLLAILLFSLVFVYHEMENLSTADDMQNLKTDSLLTLLHEKDANTIQMLRILSEANDSLLSASDIQEIISGQDSIIARQHVQNRVITKRDSLITKPQKKGFFKRLAEVFAPSRKDSAILINTSLEFATDTLLAPSTSTDSLQKKIRKASQQKRTQRKKTIHRNSASYQQMNNKLTSRMDSLIKDYEEEVTARTRQDAELQQSVRMRSARIIGGIAVGAVLLSALFLILIRRDITKSNRYRKELEDANKRAENLLEAREKLMLAITHDFKAPLGSIMGYTELLSKLTEDERQHFYLSNMKGSSEHLLRLVNDLLDFHRLDLNKAEVNRVVFTPRQLFEDIATSFQPLTTAKGLALQCCIAPQLSGSYISDPLRIHQIVNNLLSNAVKFTQKGSITLDAFYTTSRLILKITDTGKGMAAKDRERIFQEFTRLPGAQGEEGFGLGLSIVKKLVALLEGTINVESTPGEGSCFTVILPLYPVKKTTTEKPDAGLPLHILLIDDDKIQLELTAAMLKQQGISAVCCNHLEELTEQLRTHAFDVLLTDIQMPEINGFDLVNLLRMSNIPQARTIPIIAVTARSDMDEASLREHGFAGCLHKPFSVKELLAAIHHPGFSSRTDAPDTSSVDAAPSPSDSPRPAFNFSALTAFSEDDEAAGRAILLTFVEETKKNADRMKDASQHKDMNGVAAMAHKLLPLLTQIGASELADLLKWLEAQRNAPYSETAGQKVEEVLLLLDEVLNASQRLLD